MKMLLMKLTALCVERQSKAGYTDHVMSTQHVVELQDKATSHVTHVQLISVLLPSLIQLTVRRCLVCSSSMHIHWWDILNCRTATAFCL